jgi:hypothetical protein
MVAKANDSKFFTQNAYNKLECLALANIFTQVLCFLV